MQRMVMVMVLVVLGVLAACANGPRAGDLDLAWKGWRLVRDLSGVCAPDPPAWLAADASVRAEDGGTADASLLEGGADGVPE